LSPLIREAGNEEGKPSDRISLNLTEEEQTAIIAFLHTLTDEEFVTDEQFSNPFLEP
jgi:cytochrome c peroxidase